MIQQLHHTSRRGESGSYNMVAYERRQYATLIGYLLSAKRAGVISPNEHSGNRHASRTER